jgi:hypothetical protein
MMPFPYWLNIGFKVGCGKSEANLARTSRDIRMIDGDGHERAERVCVIASGSDGRERVRDGTFVRYDIRR